MLRAAAIGLAVFLMAAGAPAADTVDEAELRCLAEAIYFESRNEGVYGQIAVAEVILNRRDDPRFPSTVCGVVHQGYDPANPRLHRCQFSYYCDGKPEVFGSRDRYAQILALAWGMLLTPDRSLAGGATHYHASYVQPGWAAAMQRTRVVGRHHFYRAAEE